VGSDIKIYKKSFIGDAIAAAATFFVIVFVLLLDYQLLKSISIPIILMLLSIVIKSILRIWKLQLGHKSFMIHTLFSQSKFNYEDIKTIEIKDKGQHKELLLQLKREVMPINLSSLNVDKQLLHDVIQEKIDASKNKSA
jgi:hypothetical protein